MCGTLYIPTQPPSHLAQPRRKLFLRYPRAPAKPTPPKLPLTLVLGFTHTHIRRLEWPRGLRSYFIPVSRMNQVQKHYYRLEYHCMRWHAWSQASIQDSLLTYIQLFIGEGGWAWDSCRNGCYPSMKCLWAATSVNKQATAETPQQWPPHLPSHLLSPWNRDTFADLSPFRECAQFKGLEYNWSRGHIFSVSPKRAKHWLQKQKAQSSGSGVPFCFVLEPKEAKGSVIVFEVCLFCHKWKKEAWHSSGLKGIHCSSRRDFAR